MRNRATSRDRVGQKELAGVSDGSAPRIAAPRPSVRGATVGGRGSAWEILTAKELETMLRIDVKTIYSYVQRGLIPYVRIQSNLRFRSDEILEWLWELSYRPQSAGGKRAR